MKGSWCIRGFSDVLGLTGVRVPSVRVAGASPFNACLCIFAPWKQCQLTQNGCRQDDQGVDRNLVVAVSPTLTRDAGASETAN